MDFDKSDFVKFGKISVDAGLCWVGDPCYCVTPDASSHPAKTWDEFCDSLFKNETEGAMVWNFPSGHPGLGVSVETGYGDGEYSVYVIRRDGRVAGVFVDFMDLLGPSDEYEDEDEE